LGDILTEPCIESFPVTMMGEKIDFVRKGEGPLDGGDFRGVIFNITIQNIMVQT